MGDGVSVPLNHVSLLRQRENRPLKHYGSHEGLWSGALPDPRRVQIKRPLTHLESLGLLSVYRDVI